jgi:hypothetical protein
LLLLPVAHPELTKRELEVLQYIAIAAKRGADRSEYLKKRTSPGLDLGDRKILGPTLPADGEGALPRAPSSIYKFIKCITLLVS